MASAETSSAGIRSASASATADLPLAVGPKMPITVTGAFSPALFLGGTGIAYLEIRTKDAYGQDAGGVAFLRGRQHCHRVGDAHRGSLRRGLRARRGPDQACATDLVPRRARRRDRRV